MAMKPGERRCLPRGRVGHIVVQRGYEFWDEEAMSVCGHLLLNTDRLTPHNAPTCRMCAAGKRRTPDQQENL